jgi:dUTP pyrophosphatase
MSGQHILVKIERMFEDVILPREGTRESAGYDLYSMEDVSMLPGEVHAISTGLKMEIPQGFLGLIRSRSGQALKKGLCVVADVIDSDYRGEVKVIATNLSTSRIISFEKGERVAQIIFAPQIYATFELTDNLSKTERGAGGFGSTGLK